jgi:hypothetical protein
MVFVIWLPFDGWNGGDGMQREKPGVGQASGEGNGLWGVGTLGIIERKAGTVQARRRQEFPSAG